MSDAGEQKKRRKRESVRKECMVLTVVVHEKQRRFVPMAEVADLREARAWIETNGAKDQTYRIAYFRPEAYTVEIPDPKRKLTLWKDALG